ncbi:MAG: hypothetical protein F4X02_03445 [Chloroflexi bacterium]|nr:hypothetical protein [Chloroflexota bacterium]
MSDRPINSILAADFGSVNTRALLFDIVEGEYRLVAQGRSGTTIGAPGDDAHIGLSAALREMAEATGRRFLDERGHIIRPEQADRLGVDYYLTTASAGLALRAALVGLYPGHDLAAARRAIAPFYIEIAAAVHLEDGLGPKGRLNRIVHSRPQLILITGGADGGARTAPLEMLGVVRQAVSLLPMAGRPAVVFAGNSSLVPSAREMLSQQAEVLIAPNIVAGEGAREAARNALASVVGDYRRRESCFRRVAAMSDSGIVSTARGLETMTAFFSRALRQAVLAVDIGGARSTLTVAGKGGVWTGIRNDIGLGHGFASALELIGEDAIGEWLPFHPRKGELAKYAVKKGLRPEGVPLDMRERYIEYAMLRACLRVMFGAAREPGNSATEPARVGMALLAGAALSGSGPGALHMLMLSDALQCDGVLLVKSDPYGALAALGALAGVQPTAVVQLANRNVLEDVGAIIRATGPATADAIALRVSVRLESGELLQREIADGDVWRLSLRANSRAEVRIQARRGVSVGGKRRLRLQLTGGRGGLLFDARLDTLEKESSMTARAVKMLRWFAAVSGDDEPVVIPESWLAGPGE